VWAVCLAGAAWSAGGCESIQDFFKTDESRWLSADAIIRKPKQPQMNVIRTGISLADQPAAQSPNASPPTEEDATYREVDYVIGTTDIVDISILDLFAVGQETQLRREVSDAGYIDLPLLPQRILAKGFTQELLKDAIKAAYSPNILKDPVVSVTVVARRQNMFSVIGAVDRRGTYNIVRKDMRMLEALALAGDVTSYTVKSIYVIRPAPAVVADRDANVPAAPGVAPLPGAGPGETLGPLPTPLAPGETPAPAPGPAPGAPLREPPGGQPTTNKGELEEIQKSLPGVTPAPAPAPAPSAILTLAETSDGSAAPAASQPSEVPAPVEKSRPWIFVNGKWVQVEEGPAAAPGTPAAPAVPGVPGTPALPSGVAAKAVEANASPYEQWRQSSKADTTRVIAINYKSLMAGDSRSNIVVRDNDVIYVPREEVGEFYVMGEVQRPGVYSLTGRQITVKMAVAAAGNISQTGWPQNSILIRRIGENQEQVIPLDIEAIFYGKAYDVFLKPDDVIAVGSSIRQPFLAIFRNAFRFTYGFGFVYDRNFGSPQYGENTLNLQRFTRW